MKDIKYKIPSLLIRSVFSAKKVKTIDKIINEQIKASLSKFPDISEEKARKIIFRTLRNSFEGDTQYFKSEMQKTYNDLICKSENYKIEKLR